MKEADEAREQDLRILMDGGTDTVAEVEAEKSGG